MSDRIVLTYLIETPGSVEALARKIASDQSTGTFVALPGETPELKARVAAEVIALRMLDPVTEPSFGRSHADLAAPRLFNRGEAEIAFPIEAVGTDLAALMTIAIGGVYSIKGLSGVRITGMRLPAAFGAAWPGPQFGIAGSRRLTGVEGRPIVGTIVKPALGLRNDPYIACLMAAELVKRDRGRIEARVGRELSTTELYFAHFLGTASAGRFLSLSSDRPEASAQKAFRSAARANRSLFTEKAGRGRRGLSVAEVYERIDGMMDKRLSRYEGVAALARQPEAAPEIADAAPVRVAEPAETGRVQVTEALPAGL